MDLKTLNDLAPWEWPRNAGDVIVGALRNPIQSKSERLLAAELAGDLPERDDRLANALISVLQNSSEPDELRARAAISLGPALEESFMEGYEEDDFGEPPLSKKVFERAQHVLHEVYADQSASKELRRRALEGSVRAPEDWHTEAVRTAYVSGDREWKLTAAFGMQWVRGFDREILELLESPDPDIHYEAVRAAGDHGVKEAWPHIARLLRSSGTDRSLLLAAIEAAGNIGGDEAKEALYDLSESTDEEIAEAAEEALSYASFDEEDEEFEEDEDEEEEG